MDLVGDFFGLINKDVNGKNDTKTIPVMLRTVSVLMMGYFIFFFAMRIGKHEMFMTIQSCIGVLVFLISFILTYYEKTQIAVIMTHLYGLFWIISSTYCYGVNSGSLQLIIILLILGFMTSYSNYTMKCIYAALLIMLRITLYMLIRAFGPIVELTMQEETTFQILNTVVFMSVAAVAVVIYTKNGIQMEEKLKNYNEQLMKLANLDSLTGLSNRRCMMEYLQGCEENYLLKNDKKISVVLGDIDFFKQFNDRYGHACGDELLKQLSAVLMDFMEGQGAVARWGGEEFLLIFQDKDSLETLTQMERLLSRIRQMEIRYGGEALHVTMTFGVAQLTQSSSIDATISLADRRLYIGKQSGRNRIVLS